MFIIHNLSMLLPKCVYRILLIHGFNMCFSIMLHIVLPIELFSLVLGSILNFRKSLGAFRSLGKAEPNIYVRTYVYTYAYYVNLIWCIAVCPSVSLTSEIGLSYE